MTINFNDQGDTSAKKISVPGYVTIDYPWSNLSPSGEIKLVLRAEETQNYGLQVYYTINQGHDDRPGDFVKEIAYGFKARARDIVERFIRSVGSNASVTLEN